MASVFIIGGYLLIGLGVGMWLTNHIEIIHYDDDDVA